MSYFTPHPGGGAAPLPTAQERVDALMAAARAQAAKAPKPLFRPPPERPKALSDTDDVILRRVAEEIEYSQRILDQLGEELVSDPACVMRHQSSLQYFDVVNQILGHLARVLKTDDREEAIERIGMGELRARLTR